LTTSWEIQKINLSFVSVAAWYSLDEIPNYLLLKVGEWYWTRMGQHEWDGWTRMNRGWTVIKWFNRVVDWYQDKQGRNNWEAY